MIIDPDLWMYINLGSLAFIILLAVFSYFKKDPSLELLKAALILVVKLERCRFSQDPDESGTDQKGSSMVSNPTESHKPSEKEEEILRELEEKLEGLL